MPDKKKILFMSATSEMGGAEKVLWSCAKFLNPDKYETILLAQSPGVLTEKFTKTGKDVVLLSLPAWRKTKNIFSRYWALFKLIKIIREKNISVLHCNAFRLTPYLIYCSRILKIPGFVHLHDRLTVRQRTAFFLTKAPMILSVSECVRQPFLEFSLPTQRIYNGIAIGNQHHNNETFKKEFNIPNEAWVIGMVANFTENKRPEKFLEIASYIKKLHSHVRFVIVGQNTWNSAITMESLQQKAKDLGIGNDLILTGWRDDVQQILPAFDALVVPSVSESFSLVVLEAMAAHVVVFANQSAGGPAELIKNGRDGFLVNCDKPDETAEKIVSVLSNPTFKKEIIHNAYQRLITEFDMSIFIRNMENFYDSFFVAAQKEKELV